MEKIKYKALTFDDVLLLPRYTDFLPAQARLETKVSKNTKKNFYKKNTNSRYMLRVTTYC